VHVGDLEERLWQAYSSHQRVGVLAFLECPAPLKEATFWIQASQDSTAYAQGMYAQLRQLDDVGLEAIYIERPPNQANWATVLDRLSRASTPE
jgi:L-threonylcarbamoyladenylate synthase